MEGAGDVVQSLDRHVASVVDAICGGPLGFVGRGRSSGTVSRVMHKGLSGILLIHLFSKGLAEVWVCPALSPVRIDNN